jgi:hypothetical protein
VLAAGRDPAELEREPAVPARLADRRGRDRVQRHPLEPAGLEDDRRLLDLLACVNVEAGLEVEAAADLPRRVDVQPRHAGLAGIRGRPLSEDVRESE